MSQSGVVFVQKVWSARITAAGTGVVLNNEMDDFTAKPGVPNMFGLVQGEANAIAPGKRPMHTIMPGMATKNGRVVMPFGVMGGGYQPFGHVHLLTNMIDFGMDPQQALDAPRVFYNDDTVEAERNVPDMG